MKWKQLIRVIKVSQREGYFAYPKVLCIPQSNVLIIEALAWKFESWGQCHWDLAASWV